MNKSLILLRLDYLQRTRSYSFLITLAVTVYAAYSFVPPTDAAYTTLSVPGFRGAYNSAWVGYISATMTTVMLSLYGFLLVNNGIKKDIETEVGLIIATTPISNFKYLTNKLGSNFLVLGTIAAITFAVSILMFLIRGSSYPFVFTDFLVPYILFALPALFLVSGVAVAAEVFLGKRSILQFIIYFFICGAIMASINLPQTGIPTAVFDPFGLSLVTGSIKDQINTSFHEHIRQVSFGFIFGAHKTFKIIEWNGIKWTGIFIFSRLIWIGFSILLVGFSSIFFPRFDFSQPAPNRKKSSFKYYRDEIITVKNSTIREPLPPIITDYTIFPFIKTEFILLIRQGSKWLWLINACIWVAMIFVPLEVVNLYLLPVLWFLQVTRWSALVTKEKTYRLHFFTYSSYKPLQRMLPAQILAGLVSAILLALPLIVRCLFISNIILIFNIFLGAIMIIMLAVFLGILSDGKKLFEIVFFMLTYAMTQKMPMADYLDAVKHENQLGHVEVMVALIVFFASISFFLRHYQTRHL